MLLVDFCVLYLYSFILSVWRSTFLVEKAIFQVVEKFLSKSEKQLTIISMSKAALLNRHRRYDICLAPPVQICSDEELSAVVDRINPVFFFSRSTTER